MARASGAAQFAFSFGSLRKYRQIDREALGLFVQIVFGCEATFRARADAPQVIIGVNAA
jgi:hypothetical protein